MHSTHTGEECRNKDKDYSTHDKHVLVQGSQPGLAAHPQVTLRKKFRTGKLSEDKFLNNRKVDLNTASHMYSWGRGKNV
jgi:hypothetical protein